VLTELKKPRPNPQVIEKLMKRFIYCAGVLGAMQVATLVIMTKLTWDERAPPSAGHPDRDDVAGTDRRWRDLPVRPPPHHVPLGPAVALLVASVLLLAGTSSRFRVSTISAGTASLPSPSDAPRVRGDRRPDRVLVSARPHQGGVLVVLTLSLVVFAVHVPVLVGFTVARYDEPEPALG